MVNIFLESVKIEEEEEDKTISQKIRSKKKLPRVDRAKRERESKRERVIHIKFEHIEVIYECFEDILVTLAS